MSTTRSDEETRRSEARLRFLAELDRALLGLHCPADIIREATDRLRDHLALLACDYSPSATPPSDLGPESLPALLAGQPVVSDVPTATEPAFACFPVLSLGALDATLTLRHLGPHAWTPEELELASLVAARCWNALAHTRAARDLQQSEERYRTFIQQSSEGIWRIEAPVPAPISLPTDRLIDLIYAEVTVAECNDAFARMYGYDSAAQIQGAPLRDLLPRSDPRNIEYLRAFIASGFRLTNVESFEVARDGSPRRFLNSLVGIVEDGHLVRAWGTQRDITGQKRNEARGRVLSDAGRVLGASLDSDATLSSLCRLVVPELADWCVIHLLTDSGELRQVAIAHDDPDAIALANLAHSRFPRRADDPFGVLAVLRTGNPELYRSLTDEDLSRAAEDEDHLQMLRGLGLTSVLLVPIPGRDRTLGVMTLVSARSAVHFDEDDLRLATELAGRAGLAIENARLFQESERAVRDRQTALELHQRMERQLSLLVEASSSLSASLDLPAVLDAILVLSRRLNAADGHAIWRLVPPDGPWRVVHSLGLSDEFAAATLAVTESLRRLTDAPVVVEDVLQWAPVPERLALHAREGIRSFIIVPLVVRGQKSGTIAYYRRSPHRFDEVEIRAATALANLAGAAIGNAELYAELRDSDRRKDEFLAMLGHEIRNPLSAIGNGAQLLRTPGLGDDARDWARDVITRQVGQLTQLIDDLLNASRVSQGKVELRKRRIEIVPALLNAADAVRPLLDERGHRLETSFQPADLAIDADPVRLEQIVVNLLNNAAKYTDPGGRIALSAYRDADSVVISVRDNGTGIPPEELPRMFELFVQGKRSLGRSEGGLGIGLTLVKSLAELHGGSISASSEGRGLGSEFTVRLPAATSEPTVSAYFETPPAPAPRDRPAASC